MRRFGGKIAEVGMENPLILDARKELFVVHHGLDMRKAHCQARCSGCRSSGGEYLQA